MSFVRFFLLTLLVTCTLHAAPSSSPAPRQPNIILVLVDDMGWGDLGVRSQDRERKKAPAIDTPHFERFSAEGTQLLRHYSACPVCAPARASLFSGVHQGHAETIRNNNFDVALENSHTLASVLKAAGYSTALIGKWGIGGGHEQGGTAETAGAWPTKRGFDFFFGYHNHIAGHRHYPKEESAADPDTGHNAIWSSEEGETKEISQDCDACYSTDLFTARAKKWIIDQRKKNPKKPFFVALTLTAPHARLAVPCGPYPKGGGLKGGVQWIGKPGKMINTAKEGDWDTFIYPAYRNKNWPLSAQRHATMITRIDDAIGDLMRLMKDLKIDDRTMIVFLSDNGPHNEPGAVGGKPGHPAPAQDPAFFQSYGPFDGIKRDCWEGGLRVPALVRFPGTVKAGQKTLSPSQFHDWMATFADLAGIASPMRSDGVSLMPLLKGNAAAQPESTIYSEYAVGGATPGYGDFMPDRKGRKRNQMQVVYVDGFKGVRYDMKTVHDPFEIYDTAKDPGERNNLASQHPELQEKMEKAAMYNRRAFDYAWNHVYKRNNPISGKRPYDKALVPAVEATGLKPGATMRRVMATSPWAPAFDTLPGAARATRTSILDPTAEDLPAGSITEFQGYLDVPQDGNYTFFIQLDKVDGSKAYAKMHNFQLVDADFNYVPGTEANSSAAINAVEADPARSGHQPIPLAAGLHPVTITVVQGPESAGRLRFFWKKASGNKAPVPASAWKRSASAE